MPAKAQRQEIIAGLPPLADIIRGSLVRYYHEGCRYHPKGRYGPYWYLSIHAGGRTQMRKLKDHQVPGIRQAIKNYQRWWKTCLRIFELNTQILLSKEA